MQNSAFLLNAESVKPFSNQTENHSSPKYRFLFVKLFLQIKEEKCVNFFPLPLNAIAHLVNTEVCNSRYLQYGIVTVFFWWRKQSLLSLLFKGSRILITPIYISNCAMAHTQTAAFSWKKLLLYRKQAGGARVIAPTDLEVCGLIILCALKRENH